MNAAHSQWLTFTDVRNRLQTHALRVSEIPTEHTVSLPLPTRRWLGPAYASFASPALRRPGQAVEQGPPDRWWAVDAHGGRTLIYTLWEVFPYAEGVRWTSVTLPPTAHSVAELRQALATIEELLNALAPAFFAGERGEPNTRRALSEALVEYLPAPLLPQYRALTPDFFAWLEG